MKEDRLGLFYAYHPDPEQETVVNINAEIEGSLYLDGDYRRAQFSGSRLKFVLFDGSDLRDTDFSGCILDHVSFSGAKLRGATFENATLISCSFDGASITGANFFDAKMHATDFTYTVFDGVTALDNIKVYRDLEEAENNGLREISHVFTPGITEFLSKGLLIKRTQSGQEQTMQESDLIRTMQESDLIRKTYITDQEDSLG